MSDDIRIQLALDDLDSPDAEARIAAMNLLAQAGHKLAVPRLVEALRDEDARIRAAASEALRKIGGLTAIPALFNLLRADDLPDKARVIELGLDIIEGFRREIHDGAAAKLAAAVMQVAIIERLMQRNPEQAADELKQLKDLTAQASQEIRSVITNLKPPQTD